MPPCAACAAAAPRRAARFAPPPPGARHEQPPSEPHSNIKFESEFEFAFKKVYRRYASLYFVVGADPGDNELLCLESIHLFVECLDR